MVELNSLLIAFIGLIPTLALAIIVERHFTSFWAGVWNLFAVFLAGVSLVLVPLSASKVFVLFDRSPIDLSWLLIFYAIIVAIIGFKINPNAIRYLASSKLTAGVLMVALVAQYFLVSDIGTLGSVLFGVPLLLFAASKVAVK